MINLSFLFKQTLIYGMAAVLPRLLNLFLTPLHTANLTKSDYGIYQGMFAYMILGNVLLTYGMETAFFRFVNKHNDPKSVERTAFSSVVITTLFFGILAFFSYRFLASFLNYEAKWIAYSFTILVIDTLCALPFAWLRNKGKSLHYSLLKIGNVGLNLVLNIIFFSANGSFFSVENSLEFVFFANLVASVFTLFCLSNVYRKVGFSIDISLWKQLFRYAFPVLIAGIAFSINESFDRIFIRAFYPPNEADAVVGSYAACYKMGVFMLLFITAFKLGLEPFFFSTATSEDAPKYYALVMRYFVICGGIILLLVSNLIDFLKYLLIRNETFLEAISIVPVVLLANFCSGIYNNLSVWYKVTDQTHYGAWFSVFGAGLTIVMNLLLIPCVGYFGAGLATLVTYATMLFLSLYIGQKKYPIPYAFGTLSAYFFGSIFFSFLNFYVFNRNLFTGILFLLIFLGIILFLERKILLNFLQKRLKKNFKNEKTIP